MISKWAASKVCFNTKLEEPLKTSSGPPLPAFIFQENKMYPEIPRHSPFQRIVARISELWCFFQEWTRYKPLIHSLKYFPFGFRIRRDSTFKVVPGACYPAGLGSAGYQKP
jgi:hypothetical protein